MSVKVPRGYWDASVSCGRNERACCRAAATSSSPLTAFTCANFQMPHVSMRAKSVTSFIQPQGCHVTHRPHTCIKIKVYGTVTVLMPISLSCMKVADMKEGCFSCLLEVFLPNNGFFIL